jgi:hypothetical protein
MYSEMFMEHFSNSITLDEKKLSAHTSWAIWSSPWM